MMLNHKSLAHFTHRSALILRRGAAGRVIRDLADEIGAGAVFWNRRYGGPERDIDADLKADLRDGGGQITLEYGSRLPK